MYSEASTSTTTTTTGNKTSWPAAATTTTRAALGNSLASEPSLAKLEQVAGKARQLTEQTGALKAQLAAGEFSEAKKSAHFGESLNTFDEELVVLNRRIDRCRKLGANLAAVKSSSISPRQQTEHQPAGQAAHHAQSLWNELQGQLPLKGEGGKKLKIKRWW
ncbi:hypothetical protein TYRP_005453 [Tyrophagus putrescentiae]|nr:hypothetical protein TYRP_005453 [Tyrophagus putrescentiae]